MTYTRFLLLVGLLCAHLSLSAQSGTYCGKLNVMGTKLPLVFHFSSDGCTMDSPKQGAKGIPVQWTPSSSGEVKISIALIGASYEGKLTADNQIEGTFMQAGMKFPLILKSGNVEAPRRPQNPQPPFPYTTEEVSFKNGNVCLNGTLTLPVNSTKRTPVVVMVTGSGQQNRDEELFMHRPFAVIADVFARNGIATLRYDDRFYCDTSAVFSNYTTQDLMEDAACAIQFARQRFNKVGVLGHSEGGAIALLLAADKKVDFVVSMSGMVASGRETILQQNNDMLHAMTNLPDDVIKAYLQALGEGLDAIIAGKKPNEIALPKMLPATMSQSFQAAMKQAANPWFTHFLQVNPSAVLDKIACPVLAIGGKKDLQVNSTQHLGLLEKGLKGKKHKIVELPDLNHLLQHCQKGTIEEYGEIEETISPEALQIMVDWLKVGSIN